MTNDRGLLSNNKLECICFDSFLMPCHSLFSCFSSDRGQESGLATKYLLCVLPEDTEAGADTVAQKHNALYAHTMESRGRVQISMWCIICALSGRRGRKRKTVSPLKYWRCILYSNFLCRGKRDMTTWPPHFICADSNRLTDEIKNGGVTDIWNNLTKALLFNTWLGFNPLRFRCSW